MRGRAARSSIAIAATLGALAASAGMPGSAVAAETQRLGICTATSCQEVARLPDGLPNLALNGRLAMERICNTLPAVDRVVVEDTAFVEACVRDPNGLYPVYAAVLAPLAPGGGDVIAAVHGAKRSEFCPHQGPGDAVDAGTSFGIISLVTETPCP